MKLIIRGVTYEVREVDEIPPQDVDNADDDDVVLGALDWMNSLIEVRRDLPTERKTITLLHEVIHALAEDMDLSEEQTEEFAWRMYDFLRRNRFDVETTWT